MNDTLTVRRPLWWGSVVRAGVATAIVDGLFSSVLNVAAYGSTVARLFQGVAATLIGNAAFTGGAATTAMGIAMHCLVAFTWSAVFVLVVMRPARIRRMLASRAGAVGLAAVYGPAIWMVMSLIVVPVLLRRPPAITFRWWVQFVGHFPFVGLPIVASARWSAAADAPGERSRGSPAAPPTGSREPSSR